jgi:hypothetical protein
VQAACSTCEVCQAAFGAPADRTRPSGFSGNTRTFPSLYILRVTSLLHHLCFQPPHTFLFVSGSSGSNAGKSSTYTASHLRAKARLRVGEAVRIISGCRMSFLTKNRRTSPQDATIDQFPAAQLALLGNRMPCP